MVPPSKENKKESQGGELEERGENSIPGKGETLPEGGEMTKPRT